MVIRPAGEGLALRTRRTAAATAAVTLALGAAGCSSSYWRTSADREVEDILAGKNDQVQSERERSLVLPRASEGKPPGPGGAGEVRDPPVEVPASMSLGDALRIASICNKEYLERRESLYLSALGLSGTRYLFSPRFTAALSYLVVDAKGLKPADAADASLTGEAILPTGATLTATARTDGDFDRNAGNVLIGVSQVTANLRQPLLAGAGYESSHEQLTRAEREVVYAVRDFSRFREQFLRDATERYYGILINRAVLRNTEERHAAVEYQTRRARALFDIGLQDKLEVLRAENDLLRVKNDLNDARDALGLARDQFKVFLGLPISVQFEVPEVDPVPVPVDVSLDSAVEAALANRFDLANRREQVEDAERALRIAKQDLLPDLALEAEWTGTSAPSSDFLDQALRARTGSVGLFLELPLQRTLDRNAFRAAEIALERERRAYRQFRDEIVVEVRDSLRRLRQAATSLEIQGRIIEVEQKRYEKAQIDFNQGTIGNRDLLEAQQSLTDARNERVRRAVAYELARIDLDRSMGTIEIERDGSFRVLRAPAAAAKAGS